MHSILIVRTEICIAHAAVTHKATSWLREAEDLIQKMTVTDIELASLLSLGTFSISGSFAFLTST